MSATVPWNIPLLVEGDMVDALEVDLNNIAEALNAALIAIDALNPVGSIKLWSTNTAPTGHLMCNGTAVSRTTYARLFDVIGETYGDGDGTTTFNLPDFRGRAPWGRNGSDASFDTLGEAGGAKTVTLAQANIPYPNTAYTLDAEVFYTGPLNVPIVDNTGQRHARVINNDPDAVNKMPPYRVINFIIKY